MAKLTAAQRRVLERFVANGGVSYCPDWRTTPKLIKEGYLVNLSMGKFGLTEAGRKALEESNA